MFSFIQLSDLHLLADPQGVLNGVKPYAMFEQVLEHLRGCADTYDFVVVTGDITDEGAEAAYRLADQGLRTLGKPYYWTAGNHDRPSIMEWLNPQLSVRKDYFFEHEGVRFFLLDTSLPDTSRGAFSLHDLYHLDQTLRRHPHQPTIVLFHHAPLPIGSPWMDDLDMFNPDGFFDLIDGYDCVKGVFFGHIHQLFTEVRHGVLYQSAPAVCVQVRPMSDRFVLDHTRPGYNHISVKIEGEVKVQPVYL